MRILVLIFCFIVYGCYYDVEPPIIRVEPKVTDNPVLLVSREFKYMGTDPRSGTKSWELIAESSVVYKNSEVELENVEMRFFRGTRMVSYLRGKVGKLYPKQNRAEISEDVFLENYENKTKIYSSRLMWDGNRRLIYNTRNDRTTIVSPNATLKGSGLRTTPDVYPLELENVEAVVQ